MNEPNRTVNELKHNVTDLDQWREDRECNEDDSLALLLNRMRQIREAVPVNKKLQQDLKEKLMQRLKTIQREQADGTPTAPDQRTNKIKGKYLLGLLLVLLLAVIISWVNWK